MHSPESGPRGGGQNPTPLAFPLAFAVGLSVFQWGSNPHNPRQFLPWLSGAPAATFDRLERDQNNLARVVCQIRGRSPSNRREAADSLATLASGEAAGHL